MIARPSAATAATSALWLGLLLSGANGQNNYSLGSVEEIKATAKTLAADLWAFYDVEWVGKQPGTLPGPPSENKGDYYWWVGGAMMGTYVDYWHYTGDDRYNKEIMEGLLYQAGPEADYQPEDHIASLGNDDQGFWGMSAMLAAEVNFPNPPEGKPQWLALAQAVWVTMASPERHDDVCNGGMRWQIPSYNGGYDYKNTIANGCFFNIGARLSHYTGDPKYAEWSEKTWDWLWGVEYIDHDNWLVYDGGHDYANCTNIAKATYSYNPAILIQGAAFMYSYTKDDKWLERVEKLLESVEKRFFPKEIAKEYQCEDSKTCNRDMVTFKGYMHRWIAQTTTIIPELADHWQPILKKSAEAAIKQCTGGETGRMCGIRWESGVFMHPREDKDATSGAGEAMNVFAAVSALLVDQDSKGPKTNATGGTSVGDPNAGTHSSNGQQKPLRPINTGDRAGAAILTILVLAGAVGTFAWSCMPDNISFMRKSG
jgi:mannan endo-1,6-alpha-mannosidase